MGFYVGSWIVGSNHESKDHTLFEKKTKKTYIDIINNHINYTFIHKKTKILHPFDVITIHHYIYL